MYLVEAGASGTLRGLYIVRGARVGTQWIGATRRDCRIIPS